MMKHNLKPKEEDLHQGKTNENEKMKLIKASLFQAITLIGISMGVGAVINPYLKEAGIVLPAYIASMFVAAVFRNIFDAMKRYSFQ